MLGTVSKHEYAGNEWPDHCPRCNRACEPLNELGEHARPYSDCGANWLRIAPPDIRGLPKWRLDGCEARLRRLRRNRHVEPC